MLVVVVVVVVGLGREVKVGKEGRKRVQRLEGVQFKSVARGLGESDKFLNLVISFLYYTRHVYKR